ncbi:DUF1059 domain-containing protein [Patescibacteria group bacterium]
MNTMKCSQLGGPVNCDQELSAETWDEMSKKSKDHGMEMFKKNDENHLKAMNDMKNLMQNPEEMNKWFEDKKQEFENLS